tara:strand:+ start:256 stop:465 length:210 start_codon:yes stop_codon:yes gene_type:complete
MDRAKGLNNSQRRGIRRYLERCIQGHQYALKSINSMRNIMMLPELANQAKYRENAISALTEALKNCQTQ